MWLKETGVNCAGWDPEFSPFTRTEVILVTIKSTIDLKKINGNN